MFRIAALFILPILREVGDQMIDQRDGYRRDKPASVAKFAAGGLRTAVHAALAHDNPLGWRLQMDPTALVSDIFGKWPSTNVSDPPSM